MWYMTKYGFYSVTNARQDDNRKGAPLDPGTLQVRARLRAHLENLLARFPEMPATDIMETPENDYRWRVFVPRMEWVAVAAAMAEEITYDNFKGECARQMGDLKDGYVDALHDVWATLYAVQRHNNSQGYAPDPTTGPGRDLRLVGPGPTPRAPTAPPPPRRRARRRQRRQVPAHAALAICVLTDEELHLARRGPEPEPLAILVTDGDTHAPLGVIWRRDAYKSEAAAYSAAVQSRRLPLVAHPEYGLCSRTAYLRRHCRTAGIPVV